MVGELMRILLFVLIAGGIAALQVVLSNRRSRWPGLLLPLVYFGWRVSLLLSVTGDGTEPLLFALLFAFLPSGILLLIYYGCREKYRREVRRELQMREQERMRIQDVE